MSPVCGIFFFIYLRSVFFINTSTANCFTSKNEKQVRKPELGVATVNPTLRWQPLLKPLVTCKNVSSLAVVI